MYENTYTPKTISPIEGYWLVVVKFRTCRWWLMMIRMGFIQCIQLELSVDTWGEIPRPPPPDGATVCNDVLLVLPSITITSMGLITCTRSSARKAASWSFFLIVQACYIVRKYLEKSHICMIQFPGKTASIKRHSSLMWTDGLGLALVWIYNWMAVVLTFVRFGVCVVALWILTRETRLHDPGQHG